MRSQEDAQQASLYRSSGKSAVQQIQRDLDPSSATTSAQEQTDAASPLSMGQNKILWMQAHHGNQYVQRLLARSVVTQSGLTRNRVSRSRTVGSWKAGKGEEYEEGRSVTVQARTLPEWVEFLKEDADEADGSMELYVFMQLANGDYPSDLSNPHLTVLNGGPTRQDAVNLMIAFLTTGSDIDLPDKTDEGNAFSAASMGDVMAKFNVNFAGQALQQMTRGKDGRAREFDNSDAENVAAYGEQAKRIPTFAGHIGPGDQANPALTLVSTAVGSAFGAATQVLQAGNDPKLQNFKRDAFLLLRNSTMTIRGILDALEEPAATPPSLLLEGFSGVINGLAAASGYLAVSRQILAWGLSGIAGSWFSSISLGGHDIKKEVRKLKDDFHQQMNNVKTVTRADGKVGPLENVSDIETIKTVFDTILNY